MYGARLIVDRSKLTKEHPCHRFLPIDISSKGVEVFIQNCAMSAEGSGHSFIRVTDPSDSMPQGDFVYEGGRSNVTRVAPCQYTAMVNNDRCMIASVINHSGCFLTSAIPITDTYIRWTLIGPDGGSLHTLFKDLREKGYEFEVESIGAINQEPVLTAKQEKCFNKAVEMGYYSVPKKTDLDAIADALGISKSSLNVTLRTAERNIFRFYSKGFVVSEKKKE